MTTTAALTGFAAMVGYIVVAKTAGRPGPPPPGDDFDPVIAEGWFLCFTVAFTVGDGLYRLLGDTRSRAVVQATAAQYVPLLHTAAGLTLLAIHGSPVAAGRGTIADASLAIVGVALITISLPAVIRTIQTRRPFRRRRMDDSDSF